MKSYWHAIYLGTICILAAVLAMAGARIPTPSPVETVETKGGIADVVTPEEIARVQVALIRKTGNYGNLKWLGKPIWQPPLDAWILQETIFEVRPELIIECGTYKGGSSFFFAQLLDLMDHGRVVTIDIEKMHDLAHPRIKYLIGDSVSPEIVKQVREEVERTRGPIMVVLDSNHSQHHVIKELETYHPFVTPGSFLHIQDGVIDKQPIFTRGQPGPLGAIEAFLEKNDLFELDLERSERFLITHHPKGWLRRRDEP